VRLVEDEVAEGEGGAVEAEGKEVRLGDQVRGDCE
jgi:hypothetical protein